MKHCYNKRSSDLFKKNKVPMLVQWIKPILSNSDDTFLNNSLELKLLNHHFKINDK